MTRTATPNTRTARHDTTHTARAERPDSTTTGIAAPPRVRIAWVVARTALFGDQPDTPTDLLRLTLTLSPIGPSHARISVRLTDAHDAELSTPTRLPAPFDGGRVPVAWIADRAGEMLHVEAEGVLAATFHAPEGDPHADGARLLYVRSPLPGAIGLAGGRYPLHSANLERIEPRVSVIART